MTHSLSKLKAIVLLCSFFILLGCSNITRHHGSHGQQAIDSPFTLPADAYLALAKNQTGHEQHALIIMACGRLIEEGQWQHALHLLSSIDTTDATLRHEKDILLAKIQLMRQQPRQAISTLSHVNDVNSLGLYYQAQFHELLASAYQAEHHLPESIVERIKLDVILPDATALTNNRRALWLLLTKVPQADLTAWAIDVHNQTLKGWIELALIARNTDPDPQHLLSRIQHWQAEFVDHPASFIMPSSLESIASHIASPPQRMALLLPLSGPLSGPGQAIRDGFMAAHEASGQSHLVHVKFYDTFASTNIQALYTQAINDGAQYIVGPLSKADVATVAAMPHPVRTILLNDAAISNADNAYTFGLSPRHEARQVAVRAKKYGHRRALVIAPKSPWGDEVVQAFTEQWQRGGGVIVDRLSYLPNGDYNTAIRQFLHVSNSEEREKELRHLLGESLEASPARRQDFDLIFLLAYPTPARQIMPLLKYYYAGDIPVYATSSVYSGHQNTMLDRDLDSIIFCDMPWVFTHQMPLHPWPEPLNSYTRLYALGMDSYALATQLNQLLLFPALGIQDESGILYLTPQHEILRLLTFGEFKQGMVITLDQAK